MSATEYEEYGEVKLYIRRLSGLQAVIRINWAALKEVEKATTAMRQNNTW